MRIFVLSWFFPPENSSEGLVTYKLLSSSRHEYFVCSARSNRWGYNKKFGLKVSSSIELSSIKTDDIFDWVDYSVETFKKEHERRPFDAIMTRTMPPESILAAQRIKKEFPNLIWLASLGDPISKNPYTIQGLYGEKFSDEDFEELISAIDFPNEQNLKNSCITQELNQMKEIESFAIECSDAWIVPCEAMAEYMSPKEGKKNLVVVPHTYKKEFYPTVSTKDSSSKIRLTYIGHLDHLRNLDLLLEAIKDLKNEHPDLSQRLEVHVYGNGLSSLSNKVFNSYLYDIFKVEGDVSYLDSLRLMSESDWLIHVDASFKFLKKTGGSIFFAGKLADYMGTEARIFAITGKGSPADKIVKNCGGLCAYPEGKNGLKNKLLELLELGKKPLTEKEKKYRLSFEAREVASSFDKTLDDLFINQHEARSLKCEKILSICIPSYNSESYLERALSSINNSKYLNLLEVLIVNDGSTDGTEKIGLQWSQKNPEVYSLINKKNGGHGSTINAAIPIASGLYFKVLDADDWLDARELDSLIEKIINKNFNGNFYPDLISSNYSQINNDDGKELKLGKNSRMLSYDRVYFIDNISFSTEYFSIHSIFYKTEILKKNLANVKLQENTFYVDVEYMFLPLRFVNSFMLCKESIYRYSVGRNDQSINFKVFQKRFCHHDRVMRRMTLWLSENEKILSPSKLDYLSHLLELHYKTHVRLLTSNKTRHSFRNLKDFYIFLTSQDSSTLSRIYSTVPELKYFRFTFNNYLFFSLLTLTVSKLRDLRIKKIYLKEKLKSRLRGTPLYIPLKNLKRILTSNN